MEEIQYIDKNGNHMTKKDVQLLPPEKLEEYSGIPVKILPDTQRLYDAIAEVMINTILAKKSGKVTMILPVGPIGQYPVFVKKIKERNIDCRNLWTFNMDELLDRTGRTLAESHPLSFKGEMMRSFFANIPPELRMSLDQMFFPRYDNMDEINGAFDKHVPNGEELCLAGVGPEGHFAFNENPNFGHVEVSQEEFLADRTHLVLLNTSSVDMNALVAGCGDRSAIPPFAVTIGPSDILRAKRTESIFNEGKYQRTVLREVLFRKPTMRFPASFLKLRKTEDGNFLPQNLTVWATPEESACVTPLTPY